MAKLILVMCFSLKLIQICTLTILLSILHISANLCVEKMFRLSPLYNDVEPVDNPIKKLKVSNKMLCSTKCYFSATCTGFFYRYDGTCSLFSIRFPLLTFVKGNGSQGYETPPSVASDCYDVMMMGYSTDGRYTLTVRDSGQPMNVWCEIKHPDGWVVIQRRLGGSLKFDKTWNEYRDGFGDLMNEFWLGNAKIYRLTRQGHYELKIELEDYKGNSSYALYKNFFVASEQDNYRLNIGEYNGNAGDVFRVHYRAMFSTIDKDVDESSNNCAELYSSGWWFTNCLRCNLNGEYMINDGAASSEILWDSEPMKKTAMKIRPMI